MKFVRQNDGSQRVLLHRILLILFSVVLLLTLYANSLLGFDPLSEGTLMPVPDGWSLSYQGEVIEEDIELPYKIEGMLSGKTYVLSRILPEELPNTNVSLAFETSMRSLSVLIDGQNIYEYGLGDTPYRRPVLGGSFMHYIRLPDWAAGHELSLVMTFHSQNQFAGIIQLPTLGTKADQVLYQLRELPNLIFGIIFLFAGVLAASVSFILTPGRKRESMWYFGMDRDRSRVMDFCTQLYQVHPDSQCGTGSGLRIHGTVSPAVLPDSVCQGIILDHRAYHQNLHDCRRVDDRSLYHCRRVAVRRICPVFGNSAVRRSVPSAVHQCTVHPPPH